MRRIGLLLLVWAALWGAVPLSASENDTWWLGAAIRPMKWGYIDHSGAMVIAPQFDDALGFREGLAAVEMGHKRGYIDRTGKVVIVPQFDSTWGFADGLAEVRGSLSGFIDRSGNLVHQFPALPVSRFSWGLAAVKVGDRYGYQ